MDKRKQDIAYFISFCIEQYKNEKGIRGAEAMALLADLASRSGSPLSRFSKRQYFAN